jgi:hypothetical protein
LKRLTESRTPGQISSEEWGSTVLFASNVLKQYVFVARFLSSQLRTITMEFEKTEVIEDEVQSLLKFSDTNFRQPCTCSQPFHLHFTANQSGGGDINNIVSRLEFEQGLRSGDISLMRSWWVKETYGYPLRKKDFIDFFIQRDLFFPVDSVIHVYSLEMAATLDSFADEVESAHQELVGWMRLPCAMAFHERLGKQSNLGMVGKDVIAMISQFL